MKTTFIGIIIFIFILACNSKNKDSKNEANSNPLKSEIKKSRILNSNELNLHLLKIKSLKDICGLWKCVKIIDDSTFQEKDLSEEGELFIKGNSLYWLFYPHYRFDFYFRIELKDDLLLLYCDNKGCKNKFYTNYLIGKSNDNLIIRKQLCTYYYVSQNYDNAIINTLIKNQYNPLCLTGSWSFESVADEDYDIFDKSSLKYKVWDTLTFHSLPKTNYKVKNDTLFYFTNRKIYIYKVYYFSWSKNKGATMYLIDLNHHGESYSELTYELIK